MNSWCDRQPGDLPGVLPPVTSGKSWMPGPKRPDLPEPPCSIDKQQRIERVLFRCCLKWGRSPGVLVGSPAGIAIFGISQHPDFHAGIIFYIYFFQIFNVP